MKEPQVLTQSSGQAHYVDGFDHFPVQVLNNKSEIQRPQRLTSPTDDVGVGVRNAQDSAAIATFGVENPGQEAKPP